MILQVVLVINYCLSTPNSSFWSALKMDLGLQIFFLSQLCHMKFCQERALERLAREGRRKGLCSPECVLSHSSCSMTRWLPRGQVLQQRQSLQSPAPTSAERSAEPAASPAPASGSCMWKCLW